jgi:hypothetical protein
VRFLARLQDDEKLAAPGECVFAGSGSPARQQGATTMITPIMVFIGGFEEPRHEFIPARALRLTAFHNLAGSS